jgi:hypothetical protein
MIHAIFTQAVASADFSFKENKLREFRLFEDLESAEAART